MVVITYIAFSFSIADKFTLVFTHHIEYPFENYVSEKIIGFILGFMVVTLLYSFAFKNKIFHKIFVDIVFICYFDNWFKEYFFN